MKNRIDSRKMDTDVLNMTVKTDEELFYSRRDLHDVRMGEFVRRSDEYYDSADVVILGCPQDMGVRRNRGRSGAGGGPHELRRELYKFPVQEATARRAVFDIGDVPVKETLEETHEILSKIAYEILKAGKDLIVLGGGNDISYPDCKALSRISDELLVFNIDSHFDVRADSEPNSGTPYRQLLEEKYIHPPKFFEVANKRLVNSPVYESYLLEKGVNIHSLGELRERGIEEIFDELLNNNRADSIFWGFDLDSVRAVDAPGVSAPYPVGLTAEEICTIAGIAGRDGRSRVLEITELNPEYDIDNRTAKLAAMIIMNYLNN
jgi:formiminoglutamase